MIGDVDFSLCPIGSVPVRSIQTFGAVDHHEAQNLESEK